MLTTGVPGAIDAAYVINLDDATERWRTVVAQFDRIGVKPRRIDAVRGKALSAEQRAACCTSRCARFCTPATIGCAASHVKTWKQARDDVVSAAMIAEDDPRFVDNFRALLTQYAREFPPDWDVIYLACFGCREDENVMTRTMLSLIGATHESRDVSEHVWVPSTALTTSCYLVSAAGVRKLLAAVEGRIDDHIDKTMNRLMGSGAINAYAVRPLLATQEVSLAATSISTTKTPRGPSMLLDRVHFAQDVTWGYAVGAPFGRVGDYTVNAWTPIFFLAGLGLGLCRAQVALALAFCVLLLLLDLLPALGGDKDTVVAVCVNTALTLLGWLTGLGVRAGASALCTRGGCGPKT